MIENSPEARPQSGLKKPALFMRRLPKVELRGFLLFTNTTNRNLSDLFRSLRLYYLEWASAYQASVAHVGGSYNALEVGTERFSARDESPLQP